MSFVTSKPSVCRYLVKNTAVVLELPSAYVKYWDGSVKKFVSLVKNGSFLVRIKI